MTKWLIEEGLANDRISEPLAREEIESTLRGRTHECAVSLHDVIIHDNKKWFGEANIRLDALVVHGNATANTVDRIYSPGTFRFGRVADGEHLPIDASGLLLFYGRPARFLDISIVVSRDNGDTRDLATLIAQSAGSSGFQDTVSGLAQLAAPAPTAAVVVAAISSAASLSGVAYEALQSITTRTIGLYRATWLQHRDDFGVGRHPNTETFRIKELSFWYEIRRDKA